MSKSVKYFLFSLIAVAIVFITSIYWSDNLNDIENSFLDLKYIFKNTINEQNKISKHILIVDDGNFTRRKLNNSPLSLEQWNEYLRKLISFNTNTIAFNLPLFFPSVSSTDNDNFISILKENKNIVLPCILNNSYQINFRKINLDELNLFSEISNINVSKLTGYLKISLPFDDALKHVSQIGYSNFFPDNDGIVRKIPLLSKYEDKMVFSFTLKVLLNFLEIKEDEMKIERNILHLYSPKHNKRFQIPLTDNNEMYIQFFKNIENQFLKAQLSDIISSKEETNLSNHLIININTGFDSSPVYKTPIDPYFPGGLLVATAINTIMSEFFIVPRTILDLSITMFIIFIVLILGAIVFSPNNKYIPFIAKNSYFMFFSIIILVAFPVLTCLIFTYANKEISTIIPLFYIIVFTLIVSSYKLIIEDRERKLLMTTVKGFVSGEKLDFLMTPQGAELMFQTRKKEVSILLTDIVDFSNWSTYHNPDFIFNTLKKYYDIIENIIFKYNGTIDKKMGDALLAFFGDLSTNPNHCDDAVEAAIEIQSELKKHNFPFLTRIGINTGEVMLGNLGTDKHLDYTVIGSAVNFTKRIESNCVPGGILIGSEVWQKFTLKESFDLLPVEIFIKEQEKSLICYSFVP